MSIKYSRNKQRDESNNVINIKKYDKNNSSKDNTSLNQENEKEKENSLIEQSFNNISKIEMYPKSTGFNIINPDNLSFNQGSNKFIFNNNSLNRNSTIFNESKKKELKDIHFNIFDYYCFRRCNDKKRKKINTFYKCISLYKEQMDIINIFKDFLKNRTNLFEKRTLNDEIKIFLRQTNI